MNTEKLSHNVLELLSPAKDAATAKAAILAGADGVFIGASRFGARAAAGNDLESLRDLCNFAHRFGVRIHLTVNTLLHDSELQAAQKLIDDIGFAGADVIIVQDPAVLSMNMPDGVEVHASTQCLINSEERLAFYRDLGISQIVLPRELSLKKIARFHEVAPDVRLEAFVAGAFCVSESGNCFISEYLTKRSANRGECAQICRLPMKLLKDGRLLKEGHLLSMKDNSAGDRLLDLVKAGVSTFKIEGRLKDISYVINQTAYYRMLIDSLIEKSDGRLRRMSYGRCTRSFSPDIRQTFNRGFTSQMLTGGNHGLVNEFTPKYEGPEIGRIKTVRKSSHGLLVTVKAAKDVKLVNGDGFTFRSPVGLEGFRASEVSEVQGNQDEFQISVRGQTSAKAGYILRRNQNSSFEKLLNSKNSVNRTVGYDLLLTIEKSKMILAVKDESGFCIQAEQAFEYQPSASALSTEKILQTLSKRYDSCTETGAIKISGEQSLLTVPVSMLNALRRQAYEKFFKEKFSRKKSQHFTLPVVLPKWPEDAVDSRLILNKTAENFFRQAQVKNFSRDDLAGRSVMTCRHCLVEAYAKCRKDGGSTSGFELLIGKNRFRVVCDCRKCMMHLVPDLNGAVQNV